MQDNMLMEYLQEAKRELVSQGILNTNALERGTKAHGSHDKDSTEWRFLVAGACLLKKKKGSE
jgi:hypothetical protein